MFNFELQEIPLEDAPEWAVKLGQKKASGEVEEEYPGRVKKKDGEIVVSWYDPKNEYEEGDLRDAAKPERHSETTVELIRKSVRGTPEEFREIL